MMLAATEGPHRLSERVLRIRRWRSVSSKFAKLKKSTRFGEVFGSKIQDLHYGHKGKLGFRAFDILADGKYLDTEVFFALCARYGLETVPTLYRGPYALETIRALSEGNTTLADNHIREGVVVKPVVERIDPRIGRTALKYIGDSYLFSKSADRDTHDV